MTAFGAHHGNKMSRAWLQLVMFSTVFLTVSSITAEDEQPECGFSQICLRDPANCSPDSECKFFATFSRSSDPKQLHLRLHAQNSAQRPYVAIRFSDKRPLVNATAIYCSPKEHILRLGVEHGRRTIFATQQASDQLASISNSWAKGNVVECEFDRDINAPQRMPETQSLTSPLYVQLVTGGITKEGFPMLPDAVYTSENAVDFSAVKALPLAVVLIHTVQSFPQLAEIAVIVAMEAGGFERAEQNALLNLLRALVTETGRKEVKDRATTEEPIFAEDLKSLPEVDEGDIIFEVDGVKIDRQRRPAVIAERWRARGRKKTIDANSYEGYDSYERYESPIDDEDDDRFFSRKTARKNSAPRKKYGWRSMTGGGRSRDMDDTEDELAGLSEENLEHETKNKKKRPSMRDKSSRGGKDDKKPSGKSFTLAPDDDVFSYEDDEQGSVKGSDEFNSTNAGGVQRIALYQLGTTVLLYLTLF